MVREEERTRLMRNGGFTFLTREEEEANRKGRHNWRASEFIMRCGEERERERERVEREELM